MAKGLLTLGNVVNSDTLCTYRRDGKNTWSSRTMRRIGRLYSICSRHGDRDANGSTPVTFPVLPNLDCLGAPEIVGLVQKDRGLFGQSPVRAQDGVACELWDARPEKGGNPAARDLLAPRNGDVHVVRVGDEVFKNQLSQPGQVLEEKNIARPHQVSQG